MQVVCRLAHSIMINHVRGATIPTVCKWLQHTETGADEATKWFMIEPSKMGCMSLSLLIKPATKCFNVFNGFDQY